MTRSGATRSEATRSETARSAMQLARLIFLEARRGDRLHMSLPALGSAKELFFLLLDLFVAGLLLLFAGRGGIAVHDITEDQFRTIAEKMRAAGIECARAVAAAPPGHSSTNMAGLLAAPADLPLEDYRFVATTQGRRYTLWFSVVHNVRPSARRCGGGVHER